eukprot:scaffold12068_cov32-Tisochrysis_lutea.AAC.2
MWHEILRTASRTSYSGSASDSRHLYLTFISTPKRASPRLSRSASIRGSSTGVGVIRSDGSGPGETLSLCASAVTIVDQHSSASCCMNPRPPSACCANMGKFCRKTLTNLNGLTSCAAVERSSSPISSRIAKSSALSDSPPAPAYFCSAWDSSVRPPGFFDAERAATSAAGMSSTKTIFSTGASGTASADPISMST